MGMGSTPAELHVAGHHVRCDDPCDDRPRDDGQILEEFAPPGVPVIVAKVVEDIDALVRPIRGTHWQESQPGDREVRRQLRLILKNSGLPPSGDLYDRAYAYIREHY